MAEVAVFRPIEVYLVYLASLTATTIQGHQSHNLEMSCFKFHKNLDLIVVVKAQKNLSRSVLFSIKQHREPLNLNSSSCELEVFIFNLTNRLEIIMK